MTGRLTVEKASVHGDVLYIEGRRLLLFFDDRSKKLQDFLSIISNSTEKDRGKIEKRLRKMKVKIEISLSGSKADWPQLEAAMRSVFLKQGESMVSVVPPYWRDYFESEENIVAQAEPAKKIYYVKDDKSIVPPHVILDPAPDYSEEARDMHLQGTVLMRLVVDETGLPQDIQIEKPCGVGLDEQSVQAVQKWKFEPGRKDGNPVPVGIKTEVFFHLY